jgi:hypothetical protein
VSPDDEIRTLRARLEALERLVDQVTGEDAESADPVIFEVVSGGAGQYCSVRIVNPGGPEVIGGTPTFADGPETVAISLVSGAPATGSRYVGERVDARWVFS